MARYDFHIVDVFSAEQFGGNQLAVLTDARGISDAGLQAIAREFNFPESTFVLPASDSSAVRRVRIFTPQRELPFAGHPTVGTACVLVHEGIAGEGTFTFEEGIGPVRVEAARDHNGLSARFTVDQAPELHGDSISGADAAATLGVAPAEVMRVFAASLGIDFTFVQLRDRDSVDRASLDHAAWALAFSGRPDGQVYLFAGELADGAEIHSRLFAPAFGIPEDPATGSAASVLVAAAAMLTGASRNRFSLAIRQGVKMGRPSTLSAAAQLRGGQVVAVEVGGATAFVAEGKIEVPERYLMD